MYILLPPSEGKSAVVGAKSFRALCPDRVSEVEPVIDYLRQLSPAQQKALYGFKSDERVLESHRQNLNALDAPCIKALARYTGVVYEHIDFGSLPTATEARKRVLIVSALFGLIDGATPLPPYKLSMTPRLVQHWRERNSSRLATLAKGKPVLNLLSQTYARAVDYPALITVDFRVSGGQKAAGHFGKAIKGRFVRWLLENSIKEASDFAEFTEDGYRFDGKNFVQEALKAR